MRTLAQRIALGFFLFFSASNLLKAQDIHFSQFYNSPHTVNPALTGIFKGDERYIGSLRDQWRWVPVPWFTFGASYDKKILPKKSDNHFFSFGANLFHDRQGDSRLNLTALNAMGSYSRILNKENIITGGLLLGISSRGFDTEDLTWDKQWNGETFDPSAGSGEAFANSERIFFMETGLGINYRWQRSSRTNVDIGASVYHFIEPSAGFYNNEDQNLPRNFNLTAIGNIFLVDMVDIQVHALQQFQGQYSETMLGLLGKFYVNQQRGSELQIHAGLGYRTSGSFAPTLAVQYNQYYLSASYDIDGTNFNDILNNPRGGFEVHFRYIITHVKPLKAFKACPIY